VSAESPYVFPPDSAFCRICREQALLVGGAATAVLQAAHPGIGQGVAHYSDFTRDSWGRLVRTLQVVWTIGFGTREEAEAVRDKMVALHGRIQVAYRDKQGGLIQADGMTPDLQLWVLATLIQGSIEGYERVHGRLDRKTEEAFYRDMRVFGTYFGLAETYGPQSLEAFHTYYRGVIDSDILASDPVSREIAQFVAQPPRPHWLRWAMKPFRFLFSEVLPEPVNERLGFPSTSWRRFQMRVFCQLLRLGVPLLPEFVRFPPPYRRMVKAGSRVRDG
jgi:uncharacterized protein (DUF2236 family)